VHRGHARLTEVLVEEAVRVVPAPRAGKEDEQAAVVAGIRVAGVAGSDVGPEHLPIRAEDAALRVDVALRWLAWIRAEGRRVEPRPGRVNVLLLPHAGSIEDAPAVRILPDVEGAAAIGHTAARLGRGPVEARLAIRSAPDHELAVLP